MQLRNPAFVFGGLVLLIAVIAVVFWVPLDTGSGMIVQMRGRAKIGDQLAPVVALGILGFAGLLLIIEARDSRGTRFPSAYSLRYVGLLFAIFLAAMLLMRWTGPLAVTVSGGLDGSGGGYRELRDTVPWKYLGFLAGGTLLVAGLISFVEHRVTWRALLIGLTATVLLIVLYDLPFNDLLLPPNGDV